MRVFVGAALAVLALAVAGAASGGTGKAPSAVHLL